jgi:F0F1-type ATP synthase membrane subunit b/b'
MKKLTWILTVLGIVVLGVGSFVGQPVHNVNPNRHPNLAAAQRLSDQAFQKIVAAQQANEFDMQGHAQKAKDLLDQANKQLKLAAETANRNAK